MNKTQKQAVRSKLRGVGPQSASEAWGSQKNKNDAFWLTIGLGDAVALSGAAIELAKMHGPIVYPCQGIYERSIKSFFVNHPEVEVTELRKAQDKRKTHEGETIAPGMQLILHESTVLPRESEVDMYEHLYADLGIPYDQRWDACPIELAAASVQQRPVPPGRYIFVHDKRGARITEPTGNIYRPDEQVGESILAFRDVIEQAAEIWVINSVFWWLAEHLNPTGELHACWNAREYIPIWQQYKHRKEWIWHL